jgi:hypothetical protein
VGHLRDNGFKVSPIEVSSTDLAELKAQNGVTNLLAGCHTAIVEGYVVEGHVPAADILRMLGDRPEIAGLSVPGMPVGAPGMEVPGAEAEPFDVLAFKADGSTKVYSSH